MKYINGDDMKLLLIIFLFFVLGCNNENIYIAEKLNITDLYIKVEGEVLKEGYYKINNYITYNELFMLVGIKDTSDISNFDLESTIDVDKIFIPKLNDNISNLININNATLEELLILPGIKEKLALNIIEYRKNNGLFNNIEEIMNVNGIKEKKFLLIKDYICV